MSNEPGIGKGPTQPTEEMAPQAGSTEPTQDTPPSSELGVGSEQRVSPENAEQAEVKMHRQWAETMDALEASTETQGKYFAKFGEKSDDPNKDERGLVLIVPYLEETPPETKGILRKKVESKPNSVYVVITRDGPKRLVVQSNQYPEQVLNSITSSVKYNANNPGHSYQSRNGYYVEDEQPKLAHSIADLGNMGRSVLADITDPDIVKDVVKKSIDSSESPYKERVEKADQSAQLAGELKGMVGSLPPRE